MTRAANTKLYGLKVKDNKVCVSSLSCETDFVAGTDMFKNYINIILDSLCEKDIEKISDENMDKIKITNNKYESVFENLSLLDALKHMISKTQENCKIGVADKFDFSDKKYVVGTYLHSSPKGQPQLGMKAAFVVLEKTGEVDESINEKLKELADGLAMQIVACNPKYLNQSDVPADVVEHESKIIRDGVNAEGKVTNPEQIEKIVNSKLNSWFAEVALNEQYYVIVDHESSEGKSKVKDLVSKRGKAVGLDDMKIKEFKLFI
jgi:elongation factor Ts